MAHIRCTDSVELELQGTMVGDDLFIWVELSADGRFINWAVTRRGEERPMAAGYEPIGCHMLGKRQSPVDAVMRRLVKRYGPQKAGRLMEEGRVC